MPVSPARKTAYDVLRRVELGVGFASDLMRTSAAALTEPDQSLTTELVLGVLRRRAELDRWVEQLSGKESSSFDPEIAIILRLGIYQIRWLGRVPKHAAVNDAVELTKEVRKRSASGLVNAVLRKCDPPNSSDSGTNADSLRFALPNWLRDRWVSRFGVEATNALAQCSLEAPRTVIRVVGPDFDTVRTELAHEGIALKPCTYAADAFTVESGRITKSRLWSTGRVVIQDEASQLVGKLTGVEPGGRVLDICAAPGMKLAQLAGDLRHGLLVACDRSAERLGSMAGVVDRLLPVFVLWHRVQLDAACALPFAVKFDRILLDAPCSGTGTLARNPEIKWRLKSSDISRLAKKQGRMLEEALDVLAAGGRLVYATCSLEPEEGEQVVETVLAKRRGFRLVDRDSLAVAWPGLADLFDARGYFRTRPDLHGSDGFFAAIIERDVTSRSADKGPDLSGAGSHSL